MKKLFLLIFALPMFCTQMAVAQVPDYDADGGDDLEMGVEISAEKKLNKTWSVGVEAEYRNRDSFSEFDRFTIGPSVEYKINKWLKASVGGLYMYVNNSPDLKFHNNGSLKSIRPAKATSRYRAFVALTGDTKVGRFKFSLRERYQYTFRPGYSVEQHKYTADGYFNETEIDERPDKNYQVLRQRLGIDYDIANCPLTPFVTAEMFNGLQDNFRIEKMRYTVGVDWKVAKQHTVTLKYFYQDVNGEEGDGDVNSHLVGVGYKFKF